ncbi:bifunctional 5,10-methylene-tetrahydrofolate dehydrogenase/5,10-methylene-tetrahydrofolate cyclohydrolase [Crocinitomicaceae bacterium CZZ-1]|uniref:Bifunctional protein FolD n=1 Tax=Taishania pollutisoli TaxID=2766479 RepID=A0A8J6PC82_9FLAO|nr:tetrahydrofolate dehydrogenase/cyclohydrolase catalytic domain-containing protein [Taishania pollutisoli]MBC9812478.1 bifunctional 5,10-methylene-tetrahydrofolate dehydrogenase/5,10-methylene-tetrahydrofolate cyclohydrolase [Taishania pollutisoli]MBX2949371.1 bifunctional 5,10-methylene-tetrahydrofolate dehydrogenase/5,10-methylene-tetrahydrofolate cyclohydrolase [Crocinitomicaceae bacterium]NGF74450.1 bifunctional 5,10-methylene-tetrahydrofolate dehydrogenase/5,10-methylene-tetrahydrofolate 
MQLLDGKKTSADIRVELAEAVKQRKAQGKKIPHLAAVLVGNDGGSLTYVNAKVKSCEDIGFESTLIRYDDSISEEALLKKINELNEDPNIDGFIVQLPLPKHIDELKITQAISPSKDVDGFHPQNLGNMVLNLPGFLPATPAGILELIKRNGIETSGMHCVVIGRSNIVGSPMSILLARNESPGNCTVTLAHSRTKNLGEICRQADIIIAAIGRPGFVTAEMVKEGAVVIDVGTTRVEDPSRERGWRLCGDVDFENVAPKCSFITPVPGGVGPMTIASLMINTLKAVELKGL